MKRYKQKLREVWLQMPEFRPWLRRDPEDSYRAHCRFCKCGVNTKISDLRAHAQTKKHIKRDGGSTVTVKRSDSFNDNEDEYVEIDHATADADADYKVLPIKRVKLGSYKQNANKLVDDKSGVRASTSGPDYEAIIESLALYEPEQVIFNSESHMDEHQHEEEMTSPTNIDEEIITNAVTTAINNMKDTSQVFGDFVADRLRRLTEGTAEYAKDKIMEIILESGALDKANGH
ncbi:CG10139 [Drosophila busckii]|uniref:CG10139 n=1 Tax=Drosophila busckii TaxID=30019 RepID=A0A0M3QYA1_DROBS|nr:uncharacterized protein LOC108601844 [Drosophila busckii]ALC47259.1 CG10139 [Drosophila busckii]